MRALRERAALVRARMLEQRARQSARSVGVVLVYHRVAAQGGQPAYDIAPAVSRDAFSAELAYLAERYALVSPSDVARVASERRPGDNVPLALTFDDDTYSHVAEVLPALRKVGVAAGFYLGGWSLTQRARPWWETLQLAVDHRLLPTADVELPPAGVAAALERTPGAIRGLGRFVETLEPEARAAVGRGLARATASLPADQGLDADALRLLADGNEIGFHTLAHDPLPALGDSELALALVDGRADVEQAVGRRVDAIAYPHGVADARVAAAARSAGYNLGFTGGNRIFDAESDVLLLPRLDPWHDSLATFAITLARATTSRSSRDATSSRS
jgi:peptidoglycan/xylan/chitin deacetylase (PgdA/CDA1 family)